MRKIAALLVLLILIVSGIMIATPACAAVPKPSAPEFTLKFVDRSYDVPPTYKTDEYTGKTVVDRSGYHVENMTIEVTIKNQPFSYSFNGTTYHLYYNVRVKGHFGQDWREHYPITDGYKWGGPNYELAKYVSGPIQSSSAYTVLSLLRDYPTDAQVDFQVQAIVGHDAQEYINDHPLAPYPIGQYEPAVAFDIAGDWSNTQTITISDSASTATPTASPSLSLPTPTASASPLQNPTATPEPSSVQIGVLFGLEWEKTALVVLVLVVAVLLVAVIVLLRKISAK